MTCMHPYLVWNKSPPSLTLYRPKVPWLAIWCFLDYPILIRVYHLPILHSNISASFWTIHYDYCSHYLSSLTKPPSVVLFVSSWRSLTNHSTSWIISNHLLISCVYFANNYLKAFWCEPHFRLQISHDVAPCWNIFFKHQPSWNFQVI